MKKGTFFLAVCFATWLAGYAWFVVSLSDVAQAPDEATDAIVVLTGGRGRVEEGLTLLIKGQAKTLFISGVHPHVAPRELISSLPDAENNLNLAIELGYAAANTQENAEEVAAWMARKNYHSLRLVTSDYHMRRSLLEFRHAMLGIKIIAHPVTPDLFRAAGRMNQSEKFFVLFREYNKLLGAALRALVQDGYVL